MPRAPMPPSRQPKPAARRIADQLEPAARRAFLAAMRDVQASVDLDAIAEALRVNNVAEIGRLIDSMGETLQPLARILAQGFRVTGETTGAEVAQQTGQSFAFDAVNPRSVNWARQNSARLVLDVTNEGREAIRRVLGEAFSEGIDVRRTARRIRESIGLTSRLEQAVIHYRRDLRADGRTAEAIDRLGARYSTKLLNYRSKVIARTEIISASAHGQHEAWKQAIHEGVLGPQTQRIWLVAYDDRVCETCLPMEDQTVGMDEQFITGDGESVLMPPAHPACRCTTGLNFA